MNISEQYIVCSPQDSLHLFENNTSTSFIFELPQQLRLRGTWEMGLVEITMTPSILTAYEYLYVFCDIVESSFIRQQYLPFLRRFPIKRYVDFERTFYRQVLTDNVKRIHVYIKDEQLKQISFDDSALTCTFHIKPKHV